MMSEYRDRIYPRYASAFQENSAVFPQDAANRWGKAYDYYLRGWLSADKTASILDVACGSGKLLHFFRERGYQQIEGIDVSPEQVRIARQIIASVTEGDALEFLRAHPNQFSLVTGIDIVEHFRKPEVLEFLDLAYGALRQGGRLILQTPNAGCPWGSELRYGDFTHEVGFSPSCLARLLKLCKFSSVAVREMGPVPLGYSWRSSVRCVVWQMIRMGLKLYNVAETGSAGNGVFSRVFLISGLKQE